MPEYQYPSQEVFALRREGKHTEALKLARETYQKDPENSWVVGALGWCLYDEANRMRSKNTELGIIKKELEELKIPDHDTMLKECIDRVLGSDLVGKANAHSKNGNHREAVKLLRPLAHAEGASQNEIEAYSWVLYRKLKSCKENEQEAAKWCLEEFTNCWRRDLNPNSMLFKNILIQAKLQVDHWNGLITLVDKIELHRYSPAEFEDEEPNPDFPSFQDQLLGAVHKCLKHHPKLRTAQSSLLPWLEAWRDSFGHDEWPQYHLGQILGWSGGDEKLAKELLIKTVQRQPNQWWRWRALADVVDGELRTATLSRAVCCPDKEPTFKIPLYLEYAETLAAEEKFDPATGSLIEAIRLTGLAGESWNKPMPSWHSNANSAASVDIHAYAKSQTALADEMLSGDIPLRLGALIAPAKGEGCFMYFIKDLGQRNLRFPSENTPPPSCSIIEARFQDKPKGIADVLFWRESSDATDWVDNSFGVVDHQNEQKQFASVSLPRGKFLTLRYDRWQEAKGLNPGAMLSIKLLPDAEGRPLVLSWRQSPMVSVPGFLMEAQGDFSAVMGKAFGFIESSGERVFVPPHVAKTLTNGQHISGWAIQTSRKDGSLSWNLLTRCD